MIVKDNVTVLWVIQDKHNVKLGVTKTKLILSTYFAVVQNLKVANWLPITCNALGLKISWYEM